jgi:hypothetical protein
MKSRLILSMLVCLPIVVFCANSDDSVTYSSNYSVNQQDSLYLDLGVSIAQTISGLKSEDKQDILTLYLGSLEGSQSDRLAYKFAILEVARDKLKAFEATFEKKSHESFEKPERNKQIYAENIMNTLEDSGDTDLDLSQELSPKLEKWLILQSRIYATKSSLDLIDNIESEMKTLDKKQKEQAEKISLLLKDYPPVTLLLTGSILSLPEKYQDKLHTFLKNGSNKHEIEYVFKDD